MFVMPFLNGEVKNEVYMLLPKSFCIEAKQRKVCKLRKAIYGLKDSPLCWYEKFDSFMKSQIYVKSAYDYCLYVKITGDVKVFVVIYVDDILICGSNCREIINLKQSLKNHFKMKDLGMLGNYLGIHINQNLSEGYTSLSQKTYLENVLKKFQMFDCNGASTPVVSICLCV